ncbi:hypothetical protein N7523_005611 [Penicillium sp. IBT 18751x]|nr:hypothetical protein N7523_005797 [Penicillium sp. IBT 18751x]KAJ6117860.1 hypothetical protein N7523_005611 [Penicillium sp. IBT 18751x]
MTCTRPPSIRLVPAPKDATTFFSSPPREPGKLAPPSIEDLPPAAQARTTKVERPSISNEEVSMNGESKH